MSSPRGFARAFALSVVALDSSSLFPPLAEGETPRAQLVRYLNVVGHRQLSERERALARIHTRDELEARRRRVREAFLRLIGGLPSERTPLAARVTGRHERDGFRVENVIFESLPGFPVTANLYRPQGPGPFPAVLASMGHGDAGKAGERQGPDLARKGFVVLAYDPLGQGERLQHYDPELRASRAGGSTEEHGQAAARAELIGESVARYFVWDAMRGLDYLASRPDVDATRLGAAGCSGGGTVTTYLAALDERVKAAAIACYVTSWDAILDGPGPQEAEQSLAGFLAEGLDMADLVALIAPRPLLIASTREDFFPLEGARAVYEEGRRYYGLYDAGERISWSVGPGGHGVHKEGREAMASFFLRWLRGGEGDPADLADARLDRDDLACTDTGQVSTALRARSVADLVAERAAVLRPRPVAPSLEAQRVREAVARATGASVSAPAAPPLTVHRSLERAGYRLDVVSLPVEEGLVLWGLLAVPPGSGRKPAVLLADPDLRRRKDEPGRDLDDLARAGEVVLALELRGTLTEAELPARPSLLGPEAPLHRRAAVLGKSLAGMRVEDVRQGVSALAARADVDPQRIRAAGLGGYAVPILHAAVLDLRIAHVLLQDAPASYRAFLAHPIHRRLPELVVPGVLREYDLDDLVLAVLPRAVTLANPTDAVGQPLTRAERERELGPLQEAARRLGPGDRLRIVQRPRGEPLPW